jgi:hypothetical protein
MSRSGLSILRLQQTILAMGGLAAFVLFIVGSVRTWQPGWASLACLQTNFWVRWNDV